MSDSLKFINGIPKIATLFILLATSFWCANAEEKNEEKLLEEYINSIGPNTIVFSPSNIKQFWIEKSVLSLDNDIIITESIPLKLQLVNVNETQDCKVDIITDQPDVSFSVHDLKMNKISTSSRSNDFIQYHTASSVFHLQDTTDFIFNLVFSSDMPSIKIKRIVLSFSKNADSIYLSSPGKLIITDKNSTAQSATFKNIDSTSFSATSKGLRLFSKNRILVSDKGISVSVTVKNQGNNPVRLLIGYAPFTKNQEQIHNRNNPYKNTKSVLNVVSAEKNSNKVVVDSMTEWKNGCYLVLNAEEDYSDYPNFNFVGPKILEVKPIENGNAEIIFEGNISQEIKKGAKVRIHSSWGNEFLYTGTKDLQPGEEVTLTSSTKKDNNLFKYSPDAFSRGVHYVVPILLSFTLDQNGAVSSKEENSLLISNYIVTY